MRTSRSSRAVLVLAIGALALAGCDAAAVGPTHTAGEHMADGHGTGDGHDVMHGDAENTPPVDGARTVAVEADALGFSPDRLELVAGEPVNVELTSVDTFHDLVVDEVGFHLGSDTGRTSTGGLRLDEPGTYTAYCTVPGHRSAGMELQVVVR
jgi:plastocyanin